MQMKLCSKEGSSPTQAGSWGRFARRIYFTSSTNARTRVNQEDDYKDTIWFYVAISVVYFVLIGVVILVLLLAPKFKHGAIEHHYNHHDPALANSVEVSAVPHLPLIPVGEESSNLPITQQPFQASPKNPLWDIDPRSSIFRGEVHDYDRNSRREPESRMRLNSKFLNV